MGAPHASTNSDEANVLDKPTRCLSAYNLFYQFARDKIVCGELDFDFRTLTPEMVDESANRSIGRKRNWRKHRASHGVIGFADLARAIASWWRNLDPAVKALFMARAQLEKEKYVGALAKWKLVRGRQGMARQKLEKAPKPRQSATKGKLPPDQFPSLESRQSNGIQFTGTAYDEPDPTMRSLENSPSISPIHFEPSAGMGYDPHLQNEQRHLQNTYSFPTQSQLPVLLSLPHSSLWSKDMTFPCAQSAPNSNGAPPIVKPDFERPSLRDQSTGIELSHHFTNPTSHVASQDNAVPSQWDAPTASAPESMCMIRSTNVPPFPMNFENHGCFERPRPHPHLLHPVVHPMAFSSQQPRMAPECRRQTPGLPLQVTQETRYYFPTHMARQNVEQQFLGGTSVFRYY